VIRIGSTKKEANERKTTNQKAARQREPSLDAEGRGAKHAVVAVTTEL